MENLAVALWGSFFGMVAVMLAGAVFAYAQSLHRVALNTAWSALASGFFVLAFLGGLPFDNEATSMRFLAHLTIGVAVFLSYLLFSALGLLVRPRVRHRLLVAFGVLVLGVLMWGWWLPPREALRMGLIFGSCLAGLALVLGVRNALRGDRLAWLAVASVFFLLIAIAGISQVTLHPATTPWQIKSLTAGASTLYLGAAAALLWARYAYLVELHKAMAHGPGYDPVTRMRTDQATNRMVLGMFEQFRLGATPMGVIVVSFANLYALEKLYGLAAVNYVLFVTAGRLRRTVPAHWQVQVGRLGADGFLLMLRNAQDSGVLLELARVLQAHLSKLIVMKMPAQAGSVQTAQPAAPLSWGAELGVGVLRVSSPDARAATAVALARGVSRTAWTCPSRVAWYDEKSGEIVGMPVRPE